MYKTGAKIKGTYSNLPFEGTVYHVSWDGYIYVEITGKFDERLPVGLSIHRPGIYMLCSFRPTDKNITLEQ